MEAFWGAIRHGFIKLTILIPSDPFIPVQEIYCKGGTRAHRRAICGEGEELNASWAPIPKRMGR